MPKDSTSICFTCRGHLACYLTKRDKATECLFHSNCGICIDYVEMMVGIKNGKVVCWIWK